MCVQMGVLRKLGSKLNSDRIREELLPLKVSATQARWDGTADPFKERSANRNTNK